ncbi:monooxygenase [Nitrospinae bacterium AH_259_B05_G02_I21]|nr:monooxygenase [Nitrospinae bacterium AH_259_B05_G02_I21]
MRILQIDFKYSGPWGNELASTGKGMAEGIAAVPGLLWKIWNENRETGEAGGIYLFEDVDSLRRFKEMHMERLSNFPGISEIRAKEFEINEALTAITRGPVK